MTSPAACKLATFAVGLGWLLWGALTLGLRDWDVPVSLLMAGSTYLFAQWCVESLKKPSRWPLAALLAWWCIQGSYEVYWRLVDPSRMVEGQWQASVWLFLLCGVIWSALPRLLAGPGRPGTGWAWFWTRPRQP